MNDAQLQCTMYNHVQSRNQQSGICYVWWFSLIRIIKFVIATHFFDLVNQ
jgi:hypothetical protein